MNKIYTSYFYQIRFFTPNMIPLSTAMWDPKWYYKNYQGDWYIDGRGVINGLRVEPFMPGQNLEGYCSKECGQNPEYCKFLRGYKKQLDGLNFEDVMTRLRNLVNKVANYRNIVNPVPVFIVHEAPSNPCSERIPIQQWFKEHSIECEEWVH